MKFLVLTMMLIGANAAKAESLCDVRLGNSVGLKVVEFASGNVIHSKMSLRDATADALYMEMINLQDEGVCEEKIIARRCVLRFEKKAKKNFITLYRGTDRWVTWMVQSKSKAQNFIKSMKRVGFCS